MPYTTDTLTGTNWASRRDCSYVIRDIGTVIGEDPGLLDRMIAAATGEAKSILRSRWPDTFPFSSPPSEVREAVAVMAVYRAARNTTFSGGLEDMVSNLRKDCDTARRWLNDIADGKAQIELPAVTDGHVAAVAMAPSGEMGFRV